MTEYPEAGCEKPGQNGAALGSITNVRAAVGHSGPAGGTEQGGQTCR